MQRYKCVVAYDGSDYSGFQVQTRGRTVQGEIEKVLKKMHKGEYIKIHGSGRTDAGVHAKGQVFHFDSALDIPADQWLYALNGLTPKDMAIRTVDKVDDQFHARYAAVQKEYRYKIYFSAQRDPFQQSYAHHFPQELDKDLLKEATALLIGTHDFTSFCSAKTTSKSKFRTISEINFWETEDGLVFQFTGDGFLYHMVRIMMGTILEIGARKQTPDLIPWLFKQEDRRVVKRMAPPEGLYLWKVDY